MLHVILQFQSTQPRPKPGEAFLEMLPWLLVLVGAVLIGYMIVLYLRRRLDTRDDITTGDTGFTLADLRKLRDRGELSPEEFEVARNRMAKQLKENMQRRSDTLQKRKNQEPDGDGTSAGDGLAGPGLD